LKNSSISRNGSYRVSFMAPSSGLPDHAVLPGASTGPN
jgi:hypothetical protein